MVLSFGCNWLAGVIAPHSQRWNRKPGFRDSADVDRWNSTAAGYALLRVIRLVAGSLGGFPLLGLASKWAALCGNGLPGGVGARVRPAGLDSGVLLVSPGGMVSDRRLAYFRSVAGSVVAAGFASAHHLGRLTWVLRRRQPREERWCATKFDGGRGPHTPDRCDPRET